MCRLDTIARPYAKAAFEFSYKHNNILNWQYMLKFICEIYKNKKIKNLIFTGILSNILVYEYIKKICQNDIDEFFEIFIKIIIANKRLKIFPYILKHFIKLTYKNKKIKLVKVTSSTILNKNQKNKIKISLEKYLLSKIKINFTVNKIILSGLKINLDNKVIDGSIKNRINKLINVLKNN